MKSSLPLEIEPTSLVDPTCVGRWTLGHRATWVVVVVQLLSHVQLFMTLWTAAAPVFRPSLSPEFAQSHAHWVGDIVVSYHLTLRRPCPCSHHLGSTTVTSTQHRTGFLESKFVN